MNWIDAHATQIGLTLAVIIVLGVGNAKLIPKAKSSKRAFLALWTAFVITVICGAVLGYALIGVTTYLTGLPGLFGGVVGSVGALVALTLGWHSMYLLVALARDLADKRPDEEARKAALWLPTFLPAGWTAVVGVVTHPRGLGTGVVAAIMAGITLVYSVRIVKAALAAKEHSRFWRWFCVPVTALAGAVLIPLVAYADGVVAGMVSPGVLLIVRIVVGALGLALAVRAIADLCDHIPDQHVRNFLTYGVPVLFVYGALIVTHFSSGASTGFDLLTRATLK